jgi:hypothetical protein
MVYCSRFSVLTPGNKQKMQQIQTCIVISMFTAGFENAEFYYFCRLVGKTLELHF